MEQVNQEPGELAREERFPVEQNMSLGRPSGAGVASQGPCCLITNWLSPREWQTYLPRFVPKNSLPNHLCSYIKSLILQGAKL